MEEISLETVKAATPKRYRGTMTQSMVDDINKCIEDPDYGEEFGESIFTYLNILGGSKKWSMFDYVSAVKYFSLTAACVNQVDAYCRVFPDRLQARLTLGLTKADMTGEASRYNGNELVSIIRDQALIPLHLVNQGILQKAINKAAQLMMTAKSEKVQGDMALGLIKELRPPETNKVEVAIGLNDSAREAQERQTNAMLEIAENQRRMLAAGASLSDIQKLTMVHNTEDIEAEIDE